MRGRATDVNHLGQVVGWTSGGEIAGLHGFLWNDGVMEPLDLAPDFTYGNPRAINNAGIIVGYADSEINGLPAIISFEGTMYHLNDLVVSGDTWQELTIAEDINYAGQRVGLGAILTAKPTPSFRRPSSKIPAPATPTLTARWIRWMPASCWPV